MILFEHCGLGQLALGQLGPVVFNIYFGALLTLLNHFHNYGHSLFVRQVAIGPFGSLCLQELLFRTTQGLQAHLVTRQHSLADIVTYFIKQIHNNCVCIY